MKAKPEHECVDRVNHSRVTLSEKGKSVTFLNPERTTIYKVRVDDCLITEGPRADWILTHEGKGSVIVELKGRDVAHAIEQIFVTVGSIVCKPWIERPLKLLVVCAKYPSFDTKIAKAQVQARRAGMSLKIVCRSFECLVTDV